jgi:hypothetical protein
MTDKITKKTCESCAHLGYESGVSSQPYPELWCGKKHWDGVENTDTLLEPIDCMDWAERG